jgi:predicted negative regulator of RcsB-dependent stress response
VDDNLTDQQRAEQVRGWLSENGWYLLGGVVLGLAGLFGWRQWEDRLAHQAEEASALYAELLGAIRVQRTTRAEEIARQLAADYGSTPYVDQARLAMARLKMERSLPEEAARYLREVTEDAHSSEVGHIARLRLARVLIHQEKYDEALKTLTVDADSAFAPRYHEVRGDAYHAMGRMAEARVEYEAALEGVEAGVIDQAFVQAKLDEIGDGARSAATADATVPAPK